MELILKEDVQNLGFKDEIVKVKNGYGRNFLIPQGKAVIATLSARKIIAENLKQRAFKEKSIIDAAQAIAEKIKALEIKVPSKVGSGDKLFGSVTNADLAKSISAKSSELDKKTYFVTRKKHKTFRKICCFNSFTQRG
jgi:large subunit ribosomal protein L9